MSPPALKAALNALPHGPEFRFLDRLLALEPGVSGIAEYTVRGSEPFLAGHFPDDPLFPGVLLVEAAAQLAGIVVQAAPPDSAPARLRLTALRAVKIFGSARPGETIRIQARLLQRLGHLAQAEAEASIGGRLILQAGLTLSAEVGHETAPPKR